jgi:hypothetical protein
MKTMKIHKFLILLTLILYTFSVNYVPIAPSDTSPVALDTATGSSRPMTTKLDNGSFITIYQVTANSLNTIYYSKDLTSTGTQIIDKTSQAQPWVVPYAGSDAVALYETFDSTQTNNVIMNIFTMTPPVTMTVGTYQSATFTEMYPNFVRSGSNIAVCWSQAVNVYGRIYAIGNGTLSPSTQLTVGITCTQACNAIFVPTAGGKFAVVYKFITSPFTMKVSYLTSALAIDTTVNTGTAVQVANTPTVAGLPVACGRADGTEIAVVSINGTNLYVFIYSTASGAVIAPGPCVFNISPSNAQIAETATPGLYAVSYTSSSKAYILLTDNTCLTTVLSNNTNVLQVDATVGLNNDFSYISAVSLSTSSAFFVSYVETNTTVTPNTVRIKARLYKMTTDCTDISMFTTVPVTDPLNLANISSTKVYISSLPTGDFKSNGSAITLNVQVNRNTLTYAGGTGITTDTFTYKLSKYDNVCKATINLCGSSCATCNAIPTNTAMGCLTCAPNNYFLENTTNCYASTAVVPGYIFQTTIFKACYKTCKTCSAIGTSDLDQRCQTCLDGYVTLIDNNTLCYKITDKPDKLFYDNTINKFNYCYLSCLSCSTTGTATKNNCLTCNPQYAIIPGNTSMCFNKTDGVPGFFYDAKTNQFIKCYNSCKSCTTVGTDVTHNCSTCLDSFYNTVDSVNNCYNKISFVPQYYYENNELIFKRCYKSCSACLGNGDFQKHNCNGCLDTKGYYPIGYDNTMCYLSTDDRQGYYFDQNSNAFQACYNSCLTCKKGGDIFLPNCIACKDGQTCDPCNGVLYKDACVSSCPTYTYLDNDGRTCKDCTEDNPNCCSTYFYQSKCMPSCPDGTVSDTTGKSCFACFSNNQYFYKDACVNDCPKGSIKKDSKCIKCSDNKQLLNGDACVDACPTGLIAIGGVCELGLSFASKNIII